MKSLHISVVSPERQQLDEMLRALQGLAAPDQLSALHGRLRQLDAFAKPAQPNLLIVHLAREPDDSLEALERIAALYPALAVILVCEQQAPEFLLRAMRAGVREVVGLPLAAEALAAAVERVRRAFGIFAEREGQVLAFASCKGGSGATFLAANLAHVLAAQGGKKVALLDLNLQFGDALLFLSEQPPVSNLAEVARGIHRLDQAFLASSMTVLEGGLALLAAPEDPAQGMEVKPEHIDALLKLARSQYDFVLLDVGRTLDARSIKALDHADTIFAVLQLTLPYVRDGKRLLDVLRSLDYAEEKLKPVVNRYDKRGDIGIAEAEKALGTGIARAIPNHYQAAAASVNQGIPVLKLARASPLSKAIQAWGEEYIEAAAESAGWLTRVFKRA